MSLIILNGSPKGDNNSNTDIFIRQFVKDIKQPYEIKLISKENPAKLAAYIQAFDCVIVAMPLYIHAMPGIVLRLFEHLIPAAQPGKSIGFLVQAGFVETKQQEYLIRYLKQLTFRLHYRYLGTIQKGDCAGISALPNFFTRKLFSRLHQLGAAFEKTGTFDQAILASLEEPYTLSKSQAQSYQLAYKIGINCLPWSIMQSKKHAYRQRFDKPFQ